MEERKKLIKEIETWLKENTKGLKIKGCEHKVCFSYNDIKFDLIGSLKQGDKNGRPN